MMLLTEDMMLMTEVLGNLSCQTDLGVLTLYRSRT